MRNITILISLIITSNLYLNAKTNTVASIVRASNIVYDSVFFQTGYSHVPLYVANGILGGCFDHMGFQSRPYTGAPEGRTHIGYIGNYGTSPRGNHIQFPLFFINARFADNTSVYNLVDAKNYRQELDLFTGVLTTSYNLYGETKIQAFAHQTIPNLFLYNIYRNTTNPDKEIVLEIECETSKAQNNDTKTSKVLPVKLRFDVKKHEAHVISSTDLSQTSWTISCPGAEFQNIGTKLIVKLQNGTNDLRILVQRPDMDVKNSLTESFENLKQSHAALWEQEWKQSWINVPDERLQKIWTRMKYYTLCNFPLITEKPMIPSGLNSNIWGFTFPQDVYFVAENLPRMGNFERAEKAIQYWLDVLPDVRKYCKRIVGVEGAFYPWTPPYTDWDNFEKEKVVSPDSYELHNPAYVAAIVWHYYKYSGDTAFLKKYYPIIRDVFEYYKNISTKNSVGSYDIYHEKARGQDEHSSTDGNLRNLLCASFSAEYVAGLVVQAAAITGDTLWLSLANDMKTKGMNRANIKRENGIYTTYEGDNRPMGKQKHPVQLNPIAYLPMPYMVTKQSATQKAYENRYLLTGDAKKPLTYGWSLGEFFLASCRMKSPENALKDLNNIQPCHGADPMWIQFYESSFWERWHVSKSYYFPMMGLYQQGITDMLVQDWQGYVDVLGCIHSDWYKKSFAFNDITTLGGAQISGDWKNNKFKIVIKPGKSAYIDLQVSLEKFKISAKGQAEGPRIFKGNELVRFKFDGQNPIILQSN